MAEVVIAAPLVKERDALIQALRARGFACRVSEDGRLDSVRVPDLGAVIVAAGHGKAEFAVATQHVVEREAPGALVVAGAAGALDPRLRPGDVVLATESVEHDYKTRFHGVGPPPRHPASDALRREILSAQPDRPFSLYQGPIAGGDEDIVDAARAAEVRGLTDALCVAWEGPAGARVAAFNRVPFAEVRTVTDAADGAAAESYRVHLVDAVRNVGEVLLAWLSARAGR